MGLDADLVADTCISFAAAKRKAACAMWLCTIPVGIKPMSVLATCCAFLVDGLLCASTPLQDVLLSAELELQVLLLADVVPLHQHCRAAIHRVLQ